MNGVSSEHIEKEGERMDGMTDDEMRQEMDVILEDLRENEKDHHGHMCSHGIDKSSPGCVICDIEAMK